MIHSQLYMYNFTKVSKYFFQMVFIHIPSELANVKNK